MGVKNWPKTPHVFLYQYILLVDTIASTLSFHCLYYKTCVLPQHEFSGNILGIYSLLVLKI